ncbi:MAG: hypothetical protein H0V17_16640, partial [Deltaproteobacteria bacterium]|nr:hypothetical protein [Deltaproteobacteria bacterium]
MTKLLVLVSGLAGCLSVPDGPPVECKVTSECNTDAGEVCDEGVCYGDPPPGPFAALITPPGKRKSELVAREMLLDGLPQDGYFGTFELEKPVTFSGQIVCPNECGASELAATIVVTRPSGFVGGPLFRQVFDTEPRTGAFQLVLPPVRAGEAEYTVTVNPGKRDQPGTTTSIAELVPPLRTTLSIDKNETGKTLDLGEAVPLAITGTIVDAQD